MAKESQLWTLVKENLPKDAHVQRIETGLTGKGVPDLNYCQNGKEIWIELKSIDGNKSQLSPFQIAWLYNRMKAGGKCFVLIRKKKEKMAICKVPANDNEALKSSLMGLFEKKRLMNFYKFMENVDIEKP